ncbi:hypothetical protein [Streptomyces sp. Je 1-369]|uniref:hypothetical protein n=1 Tax=Streptomyces sp. Je 1-369 TaxID=2966192 RepID=UPI00228628EE|nr:hypothetical protein [Streptomyces sp. Je 1-369]WAL93970.1 hypothetical protein NOO62_05325 [Streptomyces sp. Je 1-369]
MNTQPAAPDPVDVALRVLLEQPTYAAQTALAAAELLDADATAPMTYLHCEHVIDTAAQTVLGHLPDVVSRESLDRLYAALPSIDGVTRGEYALRFRAAARGL